MATNRAFSPDNDDNRTGIPATSNTTTDRQNEPANSNTVHSVRFKQDMDLSEDKVAIVDTVSYANRYHEIDHLAKF